MHLNQYLRHSYRAVADGIGPWEGAALARTIVGPDLPVGPT